MKQANAIGFHGHLGQGRSCHSSLGSISSPTTSSGSGWFQKTPVITNSIFKNNGIKNFTSVESTSCSKDGKSYWIKLEII